MLPCIRSLRHGPSDPPHTAHIFLLWCVVDKYTLQSLCCSSHVCECSRKLHIEMQIYSVTDCLLGLLSFWCIAYNGSQPNQY